MPSSELAVLALVAVVVIAAVLVLVAMRQRRTHALHDRFGEEYDRILHEHGRNHRW